MLQSSSLSALQPHEDCPMRTKVVKNVATYNNTTFAESVLTDLTLIGLTVSRWRQREIALYAHPTDPNRIISVGTTFDGKIVVIADEEKADYLTALEYIRRGKVYTSE